MSDAGEPGRHLARKLYPVLGPCEDCGAPATDRHHVDGNTFNNAPENIEQLCRRCHMRKDGRAAALAAHRTPKTPPRPCSNCHRLSKPLRRGRCHACTEYLRRTGEERPVAADGSSVFRSLPPRPCGECGKLVTGLKRGRCDACYKRMWRKQRAG